MFQPNHCSLFFGDLIDILTGGQLSEKTMFIVRGYKLFVFQLQCVDCALTFLVCLLQDYEVDLYLRQKWVDERLRHGNITEILDLNDPNLVKAIWKPEVYFPNAKHAEFQFVTVPNVLIRINPDGEILYMLRWV